MEKIFRYWSSSIICKEYFGNKLFLELAAKEYIQKYRKANDVKTNLPGLNIKEEVWQAVKHEIKENIDSINKDYEENIKKDYE